jgi:hypothetical protein
MDIDSHEHPRDSHALLKTEIWEINSKTALRVESGVFRSEWGRYLMVIIAALM